MTLSEPPDILTCLHGGTNWNKSCLIWRLQPTPHRPFTACAMLDLFNGLSEVSSEAWAARVPKRPILLMSGALDPVGGNGKGVRQVEKWLNKTGHNAECKLYEGGRHEMLNEINRQEVYGDVLLFIEAVAAEGELK